MTSYQELKQCNECNLFLPISTFSKNSIKCKKCQYKRRLCIHEKRKSRCKDCIGTDLCIHNKIKEYCKDCGGSRYCIHNKQKYCCKECSINSYCEHGKQKRYCKQGCGGSVYCIHKKEKRYCRECGGSDFCIHDKLKKLCKEGCGGSAYCSHGKQKNRCKDCGGSQICEHLKEKATCIECTPKNACQLCKGKYVKKSTRFYPLCEACFSFTYPNSEIITAYKIKEKYLCEDLKNVFKDETVELIFDKRVEGGCSLRRPDVLIDKLTHCIVIECDEDQHKNYECENKRTMELFIDLGNRPLVFIRFNPDCYTRKNKKKEKSCFKPIINIEDIHKKRFYDVVKEEWERRINILIPEVKKYIYLNTFPNKEVTIVQLFYDNFD